MNQPRENPFASPRVDESIETSLDPEEESNQEFEIQTEAIVGKSPLSLPYVCLYCATDADDESAERRNVSLDDAWGLAKPTTLKVYYSVCGTCVANARFWDRKRLHAIVWCVGVCIIPLMVWGLVSMMIWEENPTPNLSTGIVLCAMFAMIGFGVRSYYCEMKIPKPPELSKHAELTIKIAGAGKEFLKRFRE